MFGNFWKSKSEFLGSDIPIMCGAMSWLSEHNLVSVISNQGGFGIIACGSMFAQDLKKEISLTKQLTDRNFGVNLISVHPALEELVEVCIEEKVSHVVFAGGFPSQSMIKNLNNAQAKVICFAPSLPVAKRMVSKGANALIIEGMEAGGHIGPVSTLVLAQEILPHAESLGVPIFIAGGIASGKTIAAYLKMGAAGCQIGTMFACSKECIAHPDFKARLIKASAREAVSSIQISDELPVVAVRAIKNEATRAFLDFQMEMLQKVREQSISKEEAMLNVEKFWAGALRRAVIEGDIHNGSLMAGQSVGMIKEEKSVKDILYSLISETEIEFSKNFDFVPTT